MADSRYEILNETLDRRKRLRALMRGLDQAHRGSLWTGKHASFTSRSSASFVTTRCISERLVAQHLWFQLLRLLEFLFSASALLIRCAMFASFSQPRIPANMVSFVLHESMLSSRPGFGETTFVFSW
jgi:hypothetical protein